MAYALFTTTFGTCGIAWGEAHFTRFQLPHETDALTEKRLSGSGGRLDEDDAPAWVRQAIARVR
ncbi:MAG TPA: hypothetical protein VIJ19_00910, partial [Opitutaceae bacterium]